MEKVVKSLIVNADDFGRSPQVNAAVLLAHRQGILTSASLMVTEPACTEAVIAARDCPALDVGLHIVACNGRSLLPARMLHGIVDDAGRFPPSEVQAGLRYALHRGLRAKLRDEFRAQIERHLELMGSLYHLDGHHNLHLHPALADILISLAAEFRIPFVRLVREPIFTTLVVARDHAPRKLRDHLLFRWLSNRAARRMAQRGLKGNDWTFGFHQTGRLSESYVLAALARLPEDSVTEFYFHPAVEVEGQPPLWPSQIAETKLLTSPQIRNAIDENHIRLTTFRELARKTDGDPHMVSQ